MVWRFTKDQSKTARDKVKQHHTKLKVSCLPVPQLLKEFFIRTDADLQVWAAAAEEAARQNLQEKEELFSGSQSHVKWVLPIDDESELDL